MRSLSLLVATATIFALACAPLGAQSKAPAAGNGIDPATSVVEKHGGVSLCWNADDAIFPEGKKYQMGATPISDTERGRALEMVRAAMQSYPDKVLRDNLRAVFLVRTLHFSGVSASGTYGADRIYVADNGAKNGYTNQWLKGTFHEEFSSVLLWRHPKILDEPAWKACNSPGFHYGSNGVGAIKNGASSTKPEAEWWHKGFISQYCTASVEEDFNQVVKYLFAHPPSDRPALVASPIIRRKAILAEAFYRKLGMNLDAATATATVRVTQ